MSNKYRISCQNYEENLTFTIQKVNLAGAAIKTFVYSLRESDLALSTIDLFGSFMNFSKYICLHRQLVSFDEEEFQIVVKISLLDSDKYLYLDISDLDFDTLFQQRQQQLLSAAQLHKMHSENACSSVIALFQSHARQIQSYNSLTKRRQNDYKKQTTKLQELQKDIAKLIHKNMQLDESISQSLSCQELKVYNCEIQEQFKEERQREAFLNDLKKIKDQQKAKALLDKDPREMTQIDLCTAELKNMRFVALFTELQYIRLPGNSISKIKGLSSLAQLVVLDLSENQVKNIQGLNNCLKLKKLVLHTNQIAKIENIFHLAALEHLSLSNNQLTAIPVGIDGLHSLNQLRIVNNNIIDLPLELQNLPNLEILSLLGNPCFSEKSKSKQVIYGLIEKKKVRTMSTCF